MIAKNNTSCKDMLMYTANRVQFRIETLSSAVTTQCALVIEKLRAVVNLSLPIFVCESVGHLCKSLNSQPQTL